MRKIVEKVSASTQASVAVTLEHAARQKSRSLLRLDDGSEAALLLERGMSLNHGDRLLADDGTVIAVEAAAEGLSVVTAADPLQLARAAYHLGNRHIAVQIGALRLCYLHDHVLDDMMRELGFQVSFAAERFEPENGAYGHGHAHLAAPHGHGQARIRLPQHHEHDHVHDSGHHHDHDHDHASQP